MKKEKLAGYGDHWLLGLLWVGLVVLVDPRGDFPLNDDWAYAQNVRTFLETGQLLFNDWLAMTLVVQVGWGALWCALFGFSHFVLRLSTLFLAGVSILALYQLARELTGRRDFAWLAALLLLADPWFVSLSFTFMTDVPFLAFFLLSLLFFMRSLRAGGWWPLVWGTVFAVLATGVRQYGLLAPLGFGVACLWRRRAWGTLLAAVAPLLVTYLALWGYTRWMEATQGLPDAWGRPGLLWDRLWAVDLWKEVPLRAGVMLWYWGIMLRPLLWFGASRPSGRRGWWAAAGALVLTAGLAVAAWGELPWGNLFYNFGLGPLTLKDGYFAWNVVPSLPGWAWTLLLAGGFAGAALLLWRGARAVPSGSEDGGARVAAGVMLLVFGGYLTIDYYMWDRYLLVAVPLWVIWLAPPADHDDSRRNLWPAGATLLLLGAFAVTATHDYLSWNRARWDALEALAAQGVPSTRIDGGFEYNADRRTGPRREVSRQGKSWWYVADDEFAVAFGPLPCYEPEAHFGFRRWLPPGRDSVWVLRRPGPARIDTFRCGAEVLTADSLAMAGGGLAFGNADRRDTARVRSGRYALKLDAEHPYGFTVRLSGVQPCDRVGFSVWRYGGRGGALVFSAPDATDFYEATAHVAERDAAGWERLLHEVTMPEGYAGEGLVVYVWHTDGEPGWYDGGEVVWGF